MRMDNAQAPQPAGARGRIAPPPRGPSPKASRRDAVSVAGVRVSSPDRVLFDEMGITKEGLARYYASLGEAIVREVTGRPLSLVRCPQGPGEGCFYQKHIDAKFPAVIGRVPIQEAKGEGLYATASSIEAVVGLVQMGVIELHVWGATAPDLEKPDRMVFDLDPDPAIAWGEVSDAAVRIRERLAELGLAAHLKTSGGKGLHVVVPLARRHSWEDVKGFSRALSESVAADDPGLFTTNMAKKERTGRIFIDYLRNSPGATTVAAYSARARPGAPVSTPLTWDELSQGVRPEAFTVATVAKRLAARGDPWAGLRDMPQRLTLPMKRRLGLR